MIRVGVVAPAMALRVGLREVLNNLPAVEVVSEAAHLDELPPCDADVLVVSDVAGLGFIEKPTAILLLSDDLATVQELLALSPQIWGVLPLDASEDELAAALRALVEGLWVGAPALTQGLFNRVTIGELGDADLTVQALTGREREVLQLAAQGLANKQIAVALGISEHTVKFHLSSLYAKLAVTSRTEAIRAGARRGWVTL